jgi:aspartate/methionine/tyrosine aminotransferase
VNPRLAKLHPYPFEKLRQIFAGITPNPNLREIKLSIGEPQHATPDFIKEVLCAGLAGLAPYPTMLSTPALRQAIADCHGNAMSPAIQAASITAWQDEAHVLDNRRQYREKFAAVVPLIGAVLGTAMPDASFHLWARVDHSAAISDTQFARALAADYNVVVLPGSFLAREAQSANPGAGFVRIALVAPLGECLEAADRI